MKPATANVSMTVSCKLISIRCTGITLQFRCVDTKELTKYLVVKPKVNQDSQPPTHAKPMLQIPILRYACGIKPSVLPISHYPFDLGKYRLLIAWPMVPPMTLIRLPMVPSCMRLARASSSADCVTEASTILLERSSAKICKEQKAHRPDH